MKKYINDAFPHLLHGGDYNPEQWLGTKEIFDQDMKLMKEANCNEMTLGVFSWSTIEPEEGKFDFSFLDEAIERIGKNGGKVIMSTPTSAPPRWLTKKYPSVLRVNSDGNPNPIRMGSARDGFCFCSKDYRKKVEEIDRRLAERYANNPTVIAWHLNNEIRGECFCKECTDKFHKFLENKYGTIDALNHAYWTKWSSGEVSTFEEVDPPISGTLYQGQYLDWQRFTNDSVRDFINFEAQIIKKVNPNAIVTTNLMPGRSLDLVGYASAIDFASVDIYPYWGQNKDIKEAVDAAWQCDYIRSLKNKPFMLMECAPGLVSWMQYNKLHRPGVDTLAAISCIAHGSDSICYFQFRKSRGACEQYHGAIVDHVGSSDTRVFKEVKETGRILQKIDEVAGTVVESKVALFYDIESRWALKDVYAFCLHKNGYYEEELGFYRTLWERSVSVDIVNKSSDLSKYSLLILPMQYIVTAELKQKLIEYVKNGGVLYATYMLGYADENMLSYLGGFPCEELKELFGIWNEEIDTLIPEDSQSISFDDKNYVAKDFCERIHLMGAECLATYQTDFYKDEPCFTVNRYGKGRAYYQAFRDTGAFKKDAIGSILDDLSIKGGLIGETEEGVTSQKRTDGKNEYLFVQNYSSKTADKIIPCGNFYDLLTNQPIQSLTLPPYGFAILKSVLP